MAMTPVEQAVAEHRRAIHDLVYDIEKRPFSERTADVLTTEAALIAAVRAEKHGSPILAFHAWLEQFVAATGRKLTQDQYAIAQAAFFAAHPGEGPHSALMLGQEWVTKVTNAPDSE